MCPEPGSRLTAVALSIVYSLALGVSNGISGTVSSVVCADYFGREHLGSIAGLAATLSRVASALGPLPLAAAFDTFGGYEAVLRIEAVTPFY